MQEFKDIDYNNKNNSKILKMLKRLRIEVENVKLELTSSIFFFRFIL